MESISSLHQVCLSVFGEVSKTAMIFVVPLFLGRLAFSNLLGEGAQAFGTLKAAVIYFGLIAGFPIILDILFSIPESYLPKLNDLSSLESSPDLLSSGIIPFALDKVIEVILAALYWLVYYLHIFFMLVMCSMAPIVFLTSTFLGVGLGIEIFLGLIIIGSSWPIIWYGFDQVHLSLVSAQSDGFGAKCLELLLTIFKGLSPLAFASMAVKSPAGQIISKATQFTLSAGKSAASPVSNVRFLQTFSNSSKNSSTLYSSATSNFNRRKDFSGKKRGSSGNGRIARSKGHKGETSKSTSQANPQAQGNKT